jgi:hypothetical protein
VLQVTQAIPEPGSWALLASGLLFIGWKSRATRNGLRANTAPA